MAPPPGENAGKAELVGLLGSLSTFIELYRPYHKTSDCSVFSERLNQFLNSNNISDENKKRAILLNTLSEECYVMVRNLCVPDLPSEKSFEDLLKILQGHFEQVVFEALHCFRRG